MAGTRLESEIDFSKLREEAIGLLSEYLALDTTNPPGDVSRAADWVEKVLQSDGIDTVRLGPSPDKQNVIGTIPARGSLGFLVLHHHMDVVAAPSEGWTVDPFGGEVKDGFIWGRGALDMKGFGVMTMLAALAIKRLGVPLRRSLRILAAADEEVGGIDGAKWLAANHLDEIGGEFFLTEGSFGRARDEFTYYPIQVGEKGVSAVKITVRGEPGHASAPPVNNAVVKMGRVIARLGDYRSKPEGKDSTVRFLEAFPKSFFDIGDRNFSDLSTEELEVTLAKLRTADEARIERVPSAMRNTFTPTMVNASLGQNVVPPKCEAFVDVRSLPGKTGDDILAELAGAIGDPEVELELVKHSTGTESTMDTEFFEALKAAIKDERPNAITPPMRSAGGTDSKHFRPRGLVCYGLIPIEVPPAGLRGIHGFDERIKISDLEHGMRILVGLVSRLCLQDGDTK